MAIAIIPARGGSQRIPRKNIRDFHGKPIIAYSIETALKSDIFDRVIVSTDSKEIMDIAEDYGAGVHVRSDKMSQDEVGTHEVVKNVLEEFSIENEAICCIYATAPLMSVEDLEYGLEVLINDDFNYTMSVGINTQADAGQFYWGGAEDFLIDMPLIDTGTGMIPIEPERVCDINTEEDFLRAEKMYEALHNG